MTFANGVTTRVLYRDEQNGTFTRIVEHSPFATVEDIAAAVDEARR